jgi:hypothetical protein
VDELRKVFNRLVLKLIGEPFIRFSNNLFFELCLPLWDADKDGGITYAEAEAAVTISDETFGGRTDIIDATDFKYLNWKPGQNSERNSVCGVFKNCTNLRYAAIKDGTYLRGAMFLNCTSLEQVELPVTVLDYLSNDGGAFQNCSSLKHITLPLNKQKYASHYFEESGLEKLEFPDAVIEISDSVCFKCKSLVEVVIGTGITTIKNIAFNSCSSMVSCYIKAVIPPSITQWTFDNNPCNFYVPRSSVDAYKTATNWSKYTSRIYGYDF